MKYCFDMFCEIIKNVRFMYSVVIMNVKGKDGI